MSNQVTTYLKYANLQMAAEALFDQKGNPTGSVYFGPIDPNVLTNGNERSSKFTPTKAAEFAKDWVVKEHLSNTKTGFSGTLFEYSRTDILALTKGLPLATTGGNKPAPPPPASHLKLPQRHAAKFSANESLILEEKHAA